VLNFKDILPTFETKQVNQHIYETNTTVQSAETNQLYYSMNSITKKNALEAQIPQN